MPRKKKYFTPDKLIRPTVNVVASDGQVVPAVIKDDGRLYRVDGGEISPPPPPAPTKPSGKPRTPGAKPEPGDELSSGEREEIDEAKKYAEYRGHGKGGAQLFESTMEQDVDRDFTFEAALKSVLNDNNAHRLQRNRTRGKLDMRALHKVEADVRSVFSKRNRPDGKDYNIVVLVDESGSMSNNGRIVRAIETAQFMASSIDAIPGVEVSIVGFNHFTVVHKKFGAKVDRAYMAAEMYNHFNDHGGCNHDYESVKEAFSMLRERTGNKILFYLSDGEPASCDGPNDPETIKAMINAERSVVTLGLGIQTDPTQIPHKIIVEDLQTMKPTLIGAMRRLIRRDIA